MDELLSTLEPKPMWSYFLELSKIPRGSKNEKAAADWVAEQARALGCEVERDEVGNVLARKAATPGREGARPIALQAHVDMVCEKNEGTQHDFLKDPIQVWRDGDLLRARGTTLGADNGIGVAAGLAVLASKDVKHGPVELLVTIDEETGLTGANAVKPGWLKAACLLNLDSEEEGELTIGCAGGVDTVARRTIKFAPVPEGKKALRIKVSGLKGGHSGIDIQAGRANSIRLLGQVLAAVVPEFAMKLTSVQGGNKRNAIPREASAVVVVHPKKETKIRKVVAQLESDWKAAYGAFDPGITFSVGDATAERVMSPADARAVIGLMLAGPHGVEAMSPDIPGLVQTSTNMGLAETKEDAVEICFLSRSSIDSSKRALAARIAGACELAGFEPAHSGGYPGWKPEPGSGLVKLINGTHQELFGKPMEIKAIHAGLECGLIGEKYPGMEMASIGPNMKDVHTPDEHLSIPSAGNFWKLLVGILERV